MGGQIFHDPGGSAGGRGGAGGRRRAVSMVKRTQNRMYGAHTYIINHLIITGSTWRVQVARSTQVALQIQLVRWDTRLGASARMVISRPQSPAPHTPSLNQQASSRLPMFMPMFDISAPRPACTQAAARTVALRKSYEALRRPLRAADGVRRCQRASRTPQGSKIVENRP